MKKLGFVVKSLPRRSYIYMLVFSAIFSSIGAVILLRSGFAISTPTGYADYCNLESNTTVIYGWAHDDDSDVGSTPFVTVRLSTGQSTTVPTNRAGYREAEIDQDIAAMGYRPSDVYGFRAVFSGVYKGSSPTISGTILNVGPGADTGLNINNFRQVNGPNYFTGNKVPDACLATVPPPPPNPTPQPQTPPVTPPSPPTNNPPRPNPPTTTTPPTNTTTSPRIIRPVPSSPPTPPSVSTNADATVTFGSVVASLLIPNGNAEKVRVIYGETEQALDQTSETVKVSPNATTILIKNLKLTTTYYYQVVRIKNDGTSVNSPTSSFKTLGLDLIVSFLNGGDTVKGIEATIASLSASGTSDENGIMTLKQLPEGTHSLTFTHEGKEYKRDIEVSLSRAQPATLADPIAGVVLADVQLVEQVSSPEPEVTPSKKGGSLWPIILTLFLLGLLGGGIFWFIRKRRTAEVYDDTYFSGLPNTPLPPTNPTTPSHHTPQIGESLKDLVISSMREEAARKRAEEKAKNPPPPNP